MVREYTLNYFNNFNPMRFFAASLWGTIWSILINDPMYLKRNERSLVGCSVFYKSIGSCISCPVWTYFLPDFYLLILFIIEFVKMSTLVVC